jgi:hypothetical protein
MTFTEHKLEGESASLRQQKGLCPGTHAAPTSTDFLLSLENLHLGTGILQTQFSSGKVSCFSKQFLMACW